jgi:hypothetical protein
MRAAAAAAAAAVVTASAETSAGQGRGYAAADNFSDRDHALLADRLADHGECLLPNLAIRHDVVWIVEIKLVDFLSRHELVDVDRALALDRDRFQLFRLHLEIFALAVGSP